MTVIYDWKPIPIEVKWIDFDSPTVLEPNLPYISKTRVLKWRKRKNFPWVI